MGGGRERERLWAAEAGDSHKERDSPRLHLLWDVSTREQHREGNNEYKQTQTVWLKLVGGPESIPGSILQAA